MVCPHLFRGRSLSQQLDYRRESSSVADSGSTTDQSCGIDSKDMRKAALYARVSSEAQQKERTIDSQVLELKRQIAAAGDVLVKEYADDGYSGAVLDRPGLEQMRQDVKTDLFDTIYFLNTDRIARDVAYQAIIIGELLKHEKQININGKDYVHNPENKFTLTVLGAVAEFERAKIAERYTRGRLHHIRLGKLASQGNRTLGYLYIKKSPGQPQSLCINPEEAAIVLAIHEMFASGKGIYNILQWLENNGVPTARGRKLWRPETIKYILRNHTYTGVRYFNSVRRVMMPSSKRGSVGYEKCVPRDRSEWIAVKVPAIVPQELFDRVQERLRERSKVYRHPVTHQLLCELVECGECGYHYSSYRRYNIVKLTLGRAWRLPLVETSISSIRKRHSRCVTWRPVLKQVLPWRLPNSAAEIDPEGTFTQTRGCWYRKCNLLGGGSLFHPITTRCEHMQRRSIEPAGRGVCADRLRPRPPFACPKRRD
jgi:DNA invertase Pin-like site-specific DNA recombinase